MEFLFASSILKTAGLSNRPLVCMGESYAPGNASETVPSGALAPAVEMPRRAVNVSSAWRNAGWRAQSLTSFKLTACSASLRNLMGPARLIRQTF